LPSINIIYKKSLPDFAALEGFKCSISCFSGQLKILDNNYDDVVGYYVLAQRHCIALLEF
jgi:hypothetical protein